MLKNGEPKCVCDCGWNGFGCSEAEGFCPTPMSYLLPGNTSSVQPAGELQWAAQSVTNVHASLSTSSRCSPASDVLESAPR